MLCDQKNLCKNVSDQCPTREIHAIDVLSTFVYKSLFYLDNFVK